MVEIIERLSEMASDDTTIDHGMKCYEILQYTIYVKPRSRFLKYVVRFCNAHAEFLNSKPDLLKIDEVLFNQDLNAFGFLAVGRAYGLFTWTEVDGKVVISGYEPRAEPFV